MKIGSAIKLTLMLAFTAFTTAPACLAASAEKIRVGYWTSGFSVGFGAVLEAGHFLEMQGLAPEYIRFTDVNGPTKALLTHSIDAAFAAPGTGAFAIGSQGAPVQIVLATQIAEATFVAQENSPLRGLADLRGKKLGMTPAGSGIYAIVSAVLERNYGMKTSDFTAVPGNEGPLVNFLRRGDIDAAALRGSTIAALPGFKVKTLGKLVDEWKRMMKTDAVPILGVALVHRDFVRDHPDATAKYVRALMDATAFGAKEPAKATDILAHTANLDVQDAKSYVTLWNQIYMASLEPADIATLKTMAAIFRSNGLLERDISDALFNPQPYMQAKRTP
jgi:NitT/TauT family transport system substrate-binding protein